jgi:zinc protease
MGYKAPVLRDVDNDSDPYALEMLAAILDGHDAARFNKKLVREQQGRRFGRHRLRQHGARPRLFYLHGTPAEGKTRAELEAALRAEIARVQRRAWRPMN